MNEKKPLILFDTDMDTDYDDAGALALLLEYVKKGKADLLGLLPTRLPPEQPPVVKQSQNTMGWIALLAPLTLIFARIRSGWHNTGSIA